MAQTIFISYSRQNLDLVKNIKAEIEQVTGAECWMDLLSIESGASQFTHNIVKGIKSSSVFLFMLSKESQNSKFALRELSYAIKKVEEGKLEHVVIVNIDNCQMCDEFDLMYGLTDIIAWNNQSQKDKLIKDLQCWIGANRTVADAIEFNCHRLPEIESELLKSIARKRTAAKTIAEAIKHNLLRLDNISRPIASFLFLDNTKISNVEICKSIAKILYNDSNHMVYIDMREFQQKQSAQRLFGDPPGCPGYEDGGLLSEAVYHKPHSVVLLDEIDKVHPTIFETLLQILDNGRMADGQGKMIDFKNTIIVMTSCLEQQYSSQALCKKSINDEDNVNGLQDEFQQLRMKIAPEIINRIDNIVIFNPINEV